MYYGVAACAECHTEPRRDQPPLLCRCTEQVIWAKEDKHKDAFNVLRGDRARQMGRLLNIADVSQNKACVVCHGVFIEEKKYQDKTFDARDGVSCVACHGAYREWVTLHGAPLERDTWRKMSRKEKEQQFGMKDLWDPVKRTELCASCHIGNAAAGKAVTHAMYAAGHPPLPGFEVATFSDAMPRHWQYLSEKDRDVQKMLNFTPEEAELEQTRLVLIGGIIEFRETMNLLAGQADGPAWPELAQFDCYACHHDLQTPSWRQRRGYAGKPGRPLMREWPLELVRLNLEHRGQDGQQLRRQLDPIRNAFAGQPFGQADEIAKAARRAAAWADSLLKQPNETRVDRAAARKLLHRLCHLPAEAVPDYDSARQTAWAFRVIYREQYPAGRPKPENDGLILQVLDTLDQTLKLKLPSGSGASILKELPEGLAKVYAYDPFAFKREMARLAKLFPDR